MSFSPSAVIDKSISLIKADRFILVPYILFFVAVHVVRTNLGSPAPEDSALTIEHMVFLGLTWTADLIVKGIVMGFAVSLYRTQVVSGRRVMARLGRRLIVLLGSSLSLMIPLGAFIYVLMTTSESESVAMILAKVAIVVALIPLSLTLEFIPTEVMANDRPMLGVIRDVWRFLTTHLKAVILFTLLMLLFMLLTIVASQVMAQIPVLGEGLLANVVMAIGYTFVYVMTGVFYLSTSTSSVDVTIEDD